MQLTETSMIHFSPTGSTKRALYTMAEGLSHTCADIDLTDETQCCQPHTFAPDALVLLGMPVYGGRLPAVAVQRFQQFHGQNAPAVLMVTYGNRDFDDALLELQDLALAQGFAPVAAAALVTQHNLMPQFGTGRPDATDQNETAKFVSQIAEKLILLTDASALRPLPIRGNHPYVSYGGVPLKPHVNSSCNGCGLCAQKCPVGAIPIQNPRSTDKERCISCMRCIASCPQHARELNPLLKWVAGKTMQKSCSGHKDNVFYC